MPQARGRAAPARQAPAQYRLCTQTVSVLLVPSEGNIYRMGTGFHSACTNPPLPDLGFAPEPRRGAPTGGTEQIQHRTTAFTSNRRTQSHLPSCCYDLRLVLNKKY